MTERTTEPEPREDDEELSLEKEKLRDLDVTAQDAGEIVGGGGKTNWCGGTGGLP